MLPENSDNEPALYHINFSFILNNRLSTIIKLFIDEEIFFKNYSIK
ncbi:hypothetical protein DDI_1475 [Dickeya dianthicola RNS04.9]|nr:hypothetical protein DDI_1475 [Dickeya dianthicola RNS04.9]